MPSLLELQSGFRDALIEGGTAEAAFLGWLVEPAETGRQRLAAYRHGVVGRLIDAIEASYPVVTALVGRPFLREAARQHAAASPSASGDLNEYGEDFSAFLADYPHAAGLPYLPDMARLEWRVQTLATGAEAPSASLADLADLAPQDWPGLVFSVAPHARLDSDWPVGALWRQHQPGGEGEAVDPAEPCRVLIHPHRGRVVVADLSCGEASLLDALAAGARLGEALARAAQAADDFEPGPALQGLSGQGLLLSARLEEETP